MTLNYQSVLLKGQAYIGGKWRSGNAYYPVLNPANGEEIIKVPDLEAKDVNIAVNAAEQALKSWGKVPAKERAALMKRWHQLILNNLDELAGIITAEQGKPLAAAKDEILYGASFIEWFAEEGKRAYGDIIPAAKSSQRILVSKEPVGVVGAITPWNFPNAMVARKVAPALAAGCTVVLKPAEDTPLSALAMAVLAEQAGLPAGVFNIITTACPADIGVALTQHSVVRKLSFTGSTATGKILLRQCSETVKKVSMELGGNAPFIVFDDACIDRAVEGAIAAKFRNTGQACICANRIFVQEGCYDEFLEKFTKAVSILKVGSGFDEGIDLGPLINQSAIDKIDALVNDAKSKHGIILKGGKSHALGGLFYSPTVIGNASIDMRCFQEEIFGPIAPIFRFKDEKEVIAMANDTKYGLAAYFYANDLARAFRVAEALEYGMVAINEGSLSMETAPFGGYKESGIGREGSKYGLDDYLEIKYILLGGIEV
ncbi:MAG: NAD-dependent succinate-semialdehyde dehydrogenase [Endozoicomonas sp. (ex Botrylloides leachii)]|nr:NAD-dependent succinate-semialdehyde dehydrogenase [Endozoicomonas sp. (ex Botrylloides leachii)]